MNDHDNSIKACTEVPGPHIKHTRGWCKGLCMEIRMHIWDRLEASI